MPLPRNRPHCGVCAQPLVKNGKTSAGTTRYRCRCCGASATRARGEITAAAQLRLFITWLLSPAGQHRLPMPARTFRARTAWCWRVPPPRPTPDGVVHPVLMLDGTYFQGWCVLITYDGTHVIDWQWCDKESKAAWSALLDRIPAPGMVVIDGGTGAAAAIAASWPDTRVQRCYFHIFQVIRRHLTLTPRLQPGRELLALTKALMKVQDLDAAAAWLGEYASWDARWEQFLKERTHAGTGAARPTGIHAGARWWYTHRRLRRARAMLRRLINRNELFTWLEPALQELQNATLPRTTSPLEGGPNAAIKALLRAHRGMRTAHAVIAVDWLLNSLTAHPIDPWSLVTDEYKTTTGPRQAPIEEPLGPALYDTGFSWEDGNGIQHGWGGRHRP